MKRVLGFLLLAIGCSNAGSDLGILPSARRTIQVKVLLDRDASGSETSADTIYANARVRLLPAGGGKAIDSALSNTQGIVFFENVPLGRYSISVTPGDSVSLAGTDPSEATLLAGVDVQTSVLALLVYPGPPIRQVRQLPLGQRVLIRGLILVGVPSFRDTTAHVQDTSGYIRLTRVSLRGGSSNSPGDTVAVIGTTSTRAGQPTLDQAIVTTLGGRPSPIPISISTAAARNANNGALDAALVLVTGAIIVDTATVAPDFRVTGNDGSGPLTILIDAQVGFNQSQFIPGKTMNLRGVLVPTGTGQWQLKPRFSSDISVF